MPWPEHYTLIETASEASRVWVYRLPQPNAKPVSEAVKDHEAEGYEFVRYGYGPAGEWGAEMVKRPGETFWWSPEAHAIHEIVCRAWGRATPDFHKRRAAWRLYGKLHSAFFAQYHQNYMPSLEQLRAGTVTPAETVAGLVARLRELPRGEFDTPAGRGIVLQVIDHLTEDA